MDKNTDKIQPVDEINLSEIDWNTLSVKDFHQLEQELQTKKALVRSNQKKTLRISGNVNVIIHNKTYEIKKVLYHRLKTMKNQKSKSKLIDEIINSHNPIEEI